MFTIINIIFKNMVVLMSSPHPLWNPLPYFLANPSFSKSVSTSPFLSVWCALLNQTTPLMPFLQIWMLYSHPFKMYLLLPLDYPRSFHWSYSFSHFSQCPFLSLALCEAAEVERHRQQLLNTSHIQPSSSPYVSPSFITPKKEFARWHLFTDY